MSYLSLNQFGFCHGSSAETALLSVTQSWIKCLICKKNLFTHFSWSIQSFHFGPYVPLLHSLSKLNLWGHLLCWVCSYVHLSSHSQQAFGICFHFFWSSCLFWSTPVKAQRLHLISQWLLGSTHVQKEYNSFSRHRTIPRIRFNQVFSQNSLNLNSQTKGRCWTQKSLYIQH